MSLDAVSGVSAGIVSNKKLEWTPGGICPKPLPNPNDVMRDHFDRQFKKQEDQSKEKPLNERNLGDWVNVLSGFLRGLPERLDKYKQY